jgi:hypothetical protein
MASTAAIVFEDVLRGNNDGPSRAGLLLYHGAATVGRVALIVDRTKEERVQHWLDSHGLTDHSWLVMPRDNDPEDPAERRLQQVTRLRLEGAAVELVVEPNPLVAAALQAAGVPTALFLHPSYARPEFRPDYKGGIKPWAVLMESVERTNQIKHDDKRTSVIL